MSRHFPEKSKPIFSGKDIALRPRFQRKRDKITTLQVMRAALQLAANTRYECFAKKLGVDFHKPARFASDLPAWLNFL